MYISPIYVYVDKVRGEKSVTITNNFIHKITNRKCMYKSLNVSLK